MKKFFTSVLLLAITTFTHAQSGILDTSFGNNGIATTQVSPTYNFATATKVQPDGKILVVGDSGEPATYKATVVRFNADGSLDTSFGTGGNATITIPTAKSFGMDVALQDDGKIVVGARTWDNVTGDFVLARLNADGSFDSSFGTNGVVIANSGASDVAASLLIADDGKIYMAGDSDNNFSIAKFNTDGTMDTSFGTNGWSIIAFSSSSYAQDIAFQNDGKIVMGGFSIISGGRYQMAAARITADGALDNSFGTDGKVAFNFGIDHDIATALGIQSDGKIVLGGHTYITSNPRLSYDFAVARLNTDGSLDTTYGNNGVTTTQIVDEANYANGLVIQADDKVVLAGRTVKEFDYDFAMIRFNTDGTLDSTFGNAGKVSTDNDGKEDHGYAIALQPDNKIILAGHSYSAGGDDSEIVVARYTNETLGIADNENVEFRLYPNPANEQITIELSDASSNYQVAIYDVLGKKVYTSEIQKVGQIDVSALASGTYLVKLNSDNKSSVVRFVKQ
ncbi:T9SS type A sorting domain-containing protein [Aequorivita sp. SDUM287046]|uniref:T9SS type A sorting domain-containing protein n=1 Tax=Aequorivita aurantiaca TaxID=3053356 RepID=A0ABT8DGL9_9FLAO|nr:T9SS type A sorting domain-containing protein [Aequorivita aurantiaca]MDN3723010.1 T9SS type A sorting domain-containing protein [Aequorivita aurantiaca]